jgi:hypothetical protein
LLFWRFGATLERPPVSAMNSTADPTQTAMLRRGTLDGFVEAATQTDGVGLSDLEAFTTVVVRTSNSVYRITTLELRGHSVLVEGGAFFPVRTRAFLAGSTFGGSCLRSGWVGVGLHLEFQVRGQMVVTSRVRSVSIERATRHQPS